MATGFRGDSFSLSATRGVRAGSFVFVRVSFTDDLGNRYTLGSNTVTVRPVRGVVTPDPDPDPVVPTPDPPNPDPDPDPPAPEVDSPPTGRPVVSGAPQSVRLPRVISERHIAPNGLAYQRRRHRKRAKPSLSAANGNVGRTISIGDRPSITPSRDTQSVTVDDPRSIARQHFTSRRQASDNRQASWLRVWHHPLGSFPNVDVLLVVPERHGQLQSLTTRTSRQRQDGIGANNAFILEAPQISELRVSQAIRIGDP